MVRKIQVYSETNNSTILIFTAEYGRSVKFYTETIISSIISLRKSLFGRHAI